MISLIFIRFDEIFDISIERMHSNPSLLPIQRSTSNEDYRYGRICSPHYLPMIVCIISRLL